MFRKITYGLFLTLERIEGVILFTLVSFATGVIILNVKNEVAATISVILFCFCQGIVLYRIGRHGQKISDEIKDFKENRKILCSTKSTSNQKELAAIKMLAFKDIKPADLSAIMDNTTANSEINNLVLDKISALREKGELEDGWR